MTRDLFASFVRIPFFPLSLYVPQQLRDVVQVLTSTSEVPSESTILLGM